MEIENLLLNAAGLVGSGRSLKEALIVVKVEQATTLSGLTWLCLNHHPIMPRATNFTKFDSQSKRLANSKRFLRVEGWLLLQVFDLRGNLQSQYLLDLEQFSTNDLEEMEISEGSLQNLVYWEELCSSDESTDDHLGQNCYVIRHSGKIPEGLLD